MELVIATHNQGKVRELRALLAGLPLTVLEPADLGQQLEVEETGSTFAENALLKAQAAAHLTGRRALGDDSGLEIAALGGAPGLYSARYSGPGASDADRIAKVLAEMQPVPAGQRQARFVAVLALCDPQGRATLVEGECAGEIAFAPRGTQGFGYDPIFLFPELGLTMAELGEDIKNQISHRARAIAQLRTILAGLAESPSPQSGA